MKTYCHVLISLLITTSALPGASFTNVKSTTLSINDTAIESKEDSIIESKVDYIEKIYFSGQNAEGLNNLIASTLQALEGQKSSLAVAMQYVFLSGIKDKASAAKKSCDVEDMLAAGIYNIDISEALKQSISKPSDKVSGQISGALNSAVGMSSNVNNMTWTTYILTGGRVNATGINGVTNTIGGVANSIIQGKQMLEQGKNTLKSLGIIKDKPCDKVQPKEIQIGEHPVPSK